ncbi:MAG: SGNH/GDSL hydrolase family protein, partial [Clostridia bacterium]|nr:SGNH/GDSL hydrolase family protein [Clostridia bacterium]
MTRTIAALMALILLLSLLSGAGRVPDATLGTTEPATTAPGETTDTTEPETTPLDTTEPETTEPETTEPEEKTPLSAKIVACLGDSITNLGRGIKTYVNYLGSETLPLTAQNVGLSGSALGVPKNGGNPALCQRYNQIRKDADIILLFGGSNDYGHSEYPVELGEVSSEDEDKKTFCGALRFLIRVLREEWPDALIVYVTPLVRNDRVWYPTIGKDPDEATGVNRFGYTLKDYRDAGIEICEKAGVPVIDAFSHPVLNPYDEESLKTYFRDGLHLNEKGA